MLSNLKNLSTILDLLDNGTLYQYNINVDTETPEKLGWSGYLIAYTSSTIGCRTNLNVFFNHASSIFTRFGHRQADIERALNVTDISSQDLQQIKAVAERALIACRKQSSPSLLQSCFETVEELTSIEVLKREFLESATKPDIILADRDAETRFLECIRSGRDDVAAQKVKLLNQFEIDVERMQWRFICPNTNIVTVRGRKSIMEALNKMLKKQTPQLDERAMSSTLNRIKQFFTQVTGAILEGQVDLNECAPDSYKEINSQLIGVRSFGLVMENFEERGPWIRRLDDICCNIATDLSQMTYSGTWAIMFEASHSSNPVAHIKSKVTIDLLHDRLIFSPAYEPIVHKHATVKDLENLKLIFS